MPTLTINRIIFQIEHGTIAKRNPSLPKCPQAKIFYPKLEEDIS